MDIIRQISENSFESRAQKKKGSNGKKLGSHEADSEIQRKTFPEQICVFKANILTDTLDGSQKIATSQDDISQIKLLGKLDDDDDDSLFEKAGKIPTPSLGILFFPTKRWKEICDTHDGVLKVFKYLGCDFALLEYAMSSRSGWYHIERRDGHGTYMFKDYLYMLLWTWNPATLQTRAMIYERSEYQQRSCLNKDGVFHIPGLKPKHLYHPMSLACVAIADSVYYFDKLINDEGDIKSIERYTGYAHWEAKYGVSQKEKKEGSGRPKQGQSDADGPEVTFEQLMEASWRIARVGRMFSNLFKSVEIALSMTGKLKTAAKLKENGDETIKFNGNTEAEKNYNDCVECFGDAVVFLEARIESIKRFESNFGERARAQLNIVTALVDRRMATEMKIIAVMTMAFLPATFFAALFAIPSLKWDEEQVVTPNFRVYLYFTIPTTFLIMVGWWLMTNQNALLNVLNIAKQWLHIGQKPLRAPKSAPSDMENQRTVELQSRYTMGHTM